MRERQARADALAAKLADALTDTLRITRAIKTPRVDEAFRSVPRHLFVDRYYNKGRIVTVDPRNPAPAQLRRIYSDDALVSHQRRKVPTSSTSEPGLVAQMLEDLLLEPAMSILEIGAGTGWNAALMGHIVGPEGRVHSVDIQADVTRRARNHIRRLGLKNVHIVTGDGGYGHRKAAPYDRIVTTANCPDISPHWADQLTPGGALLAMLQDIPGSYWCLCLRLWRRRDHLQGEVVTSAGFMMLQGAYGVRIAPLNPEKRLAAIAAGCEPRDKPAPWARIALRPQWWQRLLRDLVFFAQLEGVGVELIGRQYALKAGDSGSFCLVDADKVQVYGSDEAYEALRQVTEKWIELGGPRTEDSYLVEAWPAGARKRAPKNGWLLRRRHSQLVFRLKRPDQR
jgi:protein-L-isoaspartate(D-aspartate) O-methyltransferase